MLLCLCPLISWVVSRINQKKKKKNQAGISERVQCDMDQVRI